MNGAFELHPEAARDITEIWEHIADDSPAAAGRVREEIPDAIRGLVAFPGMGHRRPDLTGRQPLHVLAVVHGRRNPRVIAAILRGRE